MSLSSLNIYTLVEQSTDKYIGSSDYTALRNTCLLLKPLPSILSEIQSELTRILELDKQDKTTQLTLKACQEQLSQDSAEKEADLKEAQNDLHTASQIRTELASLQEQMRLNDMAIRNEEEAVIRQQLLISELELQVRPHQQSRWLDGGEQPQGLPSISAN
ncbi:MAG: hypothetical protein ACRCXC_01030 [Legionella sp.]